VYGSLRNLAAQYQGSPPVSQFDRPAITCRALAAGKQLVALRFCKPRPATCPRRNERSAAFPAAYHRAARPVHWLSSLARAARHAMIRPDDLRNVKSMIAGAWPPGQGPTSAAAHRALAGSSMRSEEETGDPGRNPELRVRSARRAFGLDRRRPGRRCINCDHQRWAMQASGELSA
jgi:hypothetical protein